MSKFYSAFFYIFDVRYIKVIKTFHLNHNLFNKILITKNKNNFNFLFDFIVYNNYNKNKEGI